MKWSKPKCLPALSFRHNKSWGSSQRHSILLQYDSAPTVLVRGLGGVTSVNYRLEGAGEMPLWLHYKTKTAWLGGREHVRINLDKSPAPTIDTFGVGSFPYVKYYVDRNDEIADKAPSDKPAYQIPSMSEISELRGKTGLKVISTFSGAGGSCLGFDWAGYDVIWASEFIEAARDTHMANFPNCYVDPNDIREVQPEDILDRIHMDLGELDVLCGSPPCGSFSLAGRRDKTWGKEKSYSQTKQRSDDLFWEFARILEGLKPKTFVAENVPGLVSGRAKGQFKLIYKLLTDCGYKVAVKQLDAQWLGVPQVRKRLIFIGVRNDLSGGPSTLFPKPLPYRYTVVEACPWMTGEETIERGYYELVTTEDFHPHDLVDGEAISLTMSDRPRKFTIPELKRICGFPDDFIVTGRFSRRWERLGRAVPPPFMRAVAEAMLPVFGLGQ